MRNVKGLATQSVRRVALEYEVSLSDISGSGKEGRVLKEDVLSHVASKTPVPSPAHTAPVYTAAAPALTPAKPASPLPVRCACAWNKKQKGALIGSLKLVTIASPVVAPMCACAEGRRLLMLMTRSIKFCNIFTKTEKMTTSIKSEKTKENTEPAQGR